MDAMTTGIISLGDETITVADTYVGDWHSGLAGVLAMSVQFRFAYGAGGTSVRAYLQSSLDQATSHFDLACVVFGTASETVILNFSGLTPNLFSGSPGTTFVPTDAAMADDTALDGVLGDRFRVKLVTTGTYTTQTIMSTRLCLR